MTITNQQSPNRNPGRQGHRPDIIVCHITEGSFDGALSWITNPASQVSYHYVVARDGRVVQAVDLADTAWANGTTSGTANNGNQHSRLATVRNRNVNANLYTISIGFEGRFSEKQGDLSAAQLIASVGLITHIRREVTRIFGITIPISRENIVGHVDITPRHKPNCPGPAFPYDKILTQLNPPQPPETMRFDIFGEIRYIPAFIRNDRTYVQARPLLESTGHTVDWDESTRTVVVR